MPLEVLGSYSIKIPFEKSILRSTRIKSNGTKDFVRNNIHYTSQTNLIIDPTLEAYIV